MRRRQGLRTKGGMAATMTRSNHRKRQGSQLFNSEESIIQGGVDDSDGERGGGKQLA